MNLGATQSTLQDIKVPEKAGGYYYNDLSKVHNRNRFIYWYVSDASFDIVKNFRKKHYFSSLFSTFFRRTNRDVLDLSEVSLDLNLIDNNIRYKFSDSPVLAVSISEIENNVIALVTTVSSVHCLKFSHPDRIHKNNDDTQAYSIFHEILTNKATRDASSLFYVIGHAAMPSKRNKN